MGSQLVNHFAFIPGPSVQRSSFDRSCGTKTTFDAGKLIPVFVDEVLPGDTFNLRAQMFVRKTASIVPVMDNLYVDVHFFFIPYRLVWDNFKKFMGEQVNPGDSTSYTVPTVHADAYVSGTTSAYGSLFDYFGLPTNHSGNTNVFASTSVSINALPLRSYLAVYNDWYRDENLSNSVDFVKTDSDQANSSFYADPKYRAKSKDYFTSCLPWPQKNNAGTTVDFLVGATVGTTGVAPTFTGTFNSSGNWNIQAVAAATPNIGFGGNTPTTTDTLKFGTTTGLQLSASTVGTINSLRTALTLQKLFERDARGGTRYTEIVRSHFGVVSPDARLQRTEFLGQVSARINEHPIPQTSATGLTGGSTPAGNLTSFGTGAGNGGFLSSFTEHGVVLGIASSRAELSYQDGIDRMWSRSTRYDFYWPALANLGEQAVYLKEIQYLEDSNDNDVFGYQERWSEYRYKKSMITGAFKSRYATPLDVWHYAQDYKSGRIALNDTFITQPQDPIDRSTAVPSQHNFLADFWFDLKCVRPMPTYSVPGMSSML